MSIYKVKLNVKFKFMNCFAHLLNVNFLHFNMLWRALGSTYSLKKFVNMLQHSLNELLSETHTSQLSWSNPGHPLQDHATCHHIKKVMNADQQLTTPNVAFTPEERDLEPYSDITHNPEERDLGPNHEVTSNPEEKTSGPSFLPSYPHIPNAFLF